MRVIRHRLPSRRAVGFAMLGLAGLILLIAAWIAVTAHLARGQLDQARADVHRLRTELTANDLAAARATADDLRRHAHRAHDLTTGPAWWLGAQLPAGGAALRTARGLAAVVDDLAGNAVPQLIAAGDRIDPSTLRRADGTVDLAAIAVAAPSLDLAAAELTSAQTRVSRLPAKTWLRSVDGARRDVLAQLGTLGQTVHEADVAANVAPAMLGASTPKYYFVAFQNDAEARGTGGLPGAFAILEADHGKVRFTKFSSDDAIRVTPVTVDYGLDWENLYHGDGTTSLYVNTNLSPNFPYAANTWIAMWRARTGQHLDGAIALDPEALSYLLAVTGPAALPDGTRVGESNVVSLTQSIVYAMFPKATAADQNVRKAYLLAIAAATSRKIVDTHGSTSALLKAAGKAAAQRRLLVWSADPALEEWLTDTPVSGVIPATNAPYVGLFINNYGGNKLDFYLDRSLQWTRTGCGSVRDVTVTITLRNNAPADGLSAYVTSRSDRHDYPIHVGDNRELVNYIATIGARLTDATLDGRTAFVDVGIQSGHPEFQFDVELPRDRTRTLVLHFTEPGTAGPPVVLRQPLVRPLALSVQDSVGCS